MSMTAEAYLAPGMVSHGSFIVHTLGGHTTGTVESSGIGGQNGVVGITANGSSDGKAESSGSTTGR